MSLSFKLDHFLGTGFHKYSNLFAIFINVERISQALRHTYAYNIRIQDLRHNQVQQFPLHINKISTAVHFVKDYD